MLATYLMLVPALVTVLVLWIGVGNRYRPVLLLGAANQGLWAVLLWLDGRSFTPWVACVCGLLYFRAYRAWRPRR